MICGVFGSSTTKEAATHHPLWNPWAGSVPDPAVWCLMQGLQNPWPLHPNIEIMNKIQDAHERTTNDGDIHVLSSQTGVLLVTNNVSVFFWNPPNDADPKLAPTKFKLFLVTASPTEEEKRDSCASVLVSSAAVPPATNGTGDSIAAWISMLQMLWTSPCLITTTDKPFTTLLWTCSASHLALWLSLPDVKLWNHWQRLWRAWCRPQTWAWRPPWCWLQNMHLQRCAHGSLRNDLSTNHV